MPFSSATKSGIRLATLLATAGFLAGCSVTADRLSAEQKMVNARALMKASFAEVEVNGPLTIDEAVAYAIKYNLDVRVQRMEEDLAQNQMWLTKLKMLPNINAETSISTRNNEVGARSEDIRTGQQNLSFSRSAEDDTNSGRLEMSYNLLDYGLNYIRAQQDANRLEIARERRKAAINALVRDARVTYMQAAIAQKMEPEVAGLISKAEKALSRSQEAYEKQLNAPLENLAYQRDLLVVLKNLRSLQAELATAKIQLAKLLNIRIGEQFELAVPDIKTETAGKMIRPDLEQLEVYAVVNRPELAEEDFNLTIEKLERRRIWISMLPVIEPRISYNYDDNQYLLNSDWWSISARVAYSLMQPLTLPAQLKNADDRLAYVALRRDALTLSVLSQVNIAYIQHLNALRALETSSELASIEGKISEQIDNAASTKSMSEQDSVLGQAKALLSRVERDLDYIAVDSSVLQLMSSIGYNTAPENIDDYDAASLAKMMGQKNSAILTNAKNIKRFESYNEVRDQMAFDASYATKSNRPWFVRTGPFKSQKDVANATKEITKILMKASNNASDLMPPIPHVRLDDGDLGEYYLALDTLNTLTPVQICDALSAEKMTCEINKDPQQATQAQAQDVKKWSFLEWSISDLFRKQDNAEPAPAAPAPATETAP